MKIKKRSIDYFNVLVALAFSGNQAITTKNFQEPLLILFTLFLTLFYSKEILKRLKSFSIVLVLFLIVFSFQIFSFGVLNIVSYLGFLTRLYIGFVIFTSISNFPQLYIKTLTHLTIMSLLFFIPSLIIPEFHQLFKPFESLVNASSEYRINIGLHNFMPHHDRNAGFFWEPGAFAGYLIIAVLFQYIMAIYHKTSINKKNFFILAIGVISTFSTTGYIALIALIILSFHSKVIFYNKKYKPLRFIFIPIIFLLIMKIFLSLDFLYEKIIFQNEKITDQAYNWQTTRIGSLIFDIDYIKDRPLTGWGVHNSTRFSKRPGDEEFSGGMGNGMSSFIARNGIPLFILLCFFIFKGLNNTFCLNRTQSLLLLFLLLLLLQGEVFLRFPIFLGFFFLGYINLKSNEEILILPNRSNK
jgi:hypothetical protein